MVHQQFKVGLDTGEYNRSLSKMESDTKRSTSRSAAEFKKMDRAASQAGTKRAYMAGNVALQAQDVAVQLQSGASAGRILAQQGSQIASIFGPGGAIVGGLIAIGALIWESVAGAKALKKEAEEKAKLDKINANTQATKQAVNEAKAMEDQIKLGKIRLQQGDEAAKKAEKQLDLENRISAIRNNPNLGEGVKDILVEQAKEVAALNEKADFKRESRERGIKRIQEEGNKILERADQIRGKAPSKAEQRREDRAQSRAERRAIAEELDRQDRAKRNKLQGTEDPSEKGLSKKEKDEAAKARKAAVEAAKKKEDVKLDDETIRKILNGIDGLIAR